MKTRKKFTGVVSALLAVSTLATAVPAQAQEERRERGQPRTMEQRQHRPGTPDWVAQRRAGAVTQAPVESRADASRQRERWNGDSSRGTWSGERRDVQREDRNRNRDGDRSTWNRDRDRGEWERNRDRNRQVWNRDRDSNDNRRWDRDWRRDNRYDWQRYRTYNRSIYRMPRYYAPYGWNQGYRSFSIGVVLNSGLYNRNYWINDPGYYRLPPAYGYMRWVRYYDDALLVDVRDGYVVDVIRNFFW